MRLTGLNPKKRTHVMQRALPLRFYTKTNEHFVYALTGTLDDNGKPVKWRTTAYTIHNPLTNRRLARRMRKAAKLALLTNHS
jgi:hypothetical protein